MLVNSRSNKVVNIASTKMMKRFFGTADFFSASLPGSRNRTVRASLEGWRRAFAGVHFAT
jgi:hypothetical protein